MHDGGVGILVRRVAVAALGMGDGEIRAVGSLEGLRSQAAVVHEEQLAAGIVFEAEQRRSGARTLEVRAHFLELLGLPRRDGGD